MLLARCRPHCARIAAPRRCRTVAAAPRLPLRRPAQPRARQPPPPPRAAQEPADGPTNQPATSPLYAAGGLLLWAGLLGYAVLLSPNQTPTRDAAFIASLVGAGPDANVGPVFTSIFNVMGVWPALFSCLLIPAAKSGNKVPAWPFVAASFFLGFFALGPFLALWTPAADAVAPPPRSELEAGGVKSYLLRALESRWVAIGLLAAAAWQIGSALTAGPAAWALYFNQFDESRFVHVTTLDFCTLTALAPFWLANDAGARKWAQREVGVPLLSAIPVLGPALYLVLRPRAGDGE